MLSIKDLEQYSATYSIERLQSFVYKENDSIEDVLEHYINNVKISQSLYSALCTLEVLLRNAIDIVFRTYLSETWLEDELKNRNILDENDYNILFNTYELTVKECKSPSKQYSHGRLVANLNFGFWTNLCAKKYSIKIWNKMYCFKGVFANYPNTKPEIAVISKKLYLVRRLRNRIFHYEQIFRYPEKTLHLYNIILELISYLPDDKIKVVEKTSTFLSVYNSLVTTNYIH